MTLVFILCGLLYAASLVILPDLYITNMSLRALRDTWIFPLILLELIVQYGSNLVHRV